jgi:ABC-2 type transport system ATP-binding protein
MKNEAVEAALLTKEYRRMFGEPTRALQGVDLIIPRGIAFGLIGLNGAGKTTFIKSMLAVVRPTSGALLVLGGSPADPKIRARIGYLPERLYFPPYATPRTYLRSIADLKAVSLEEKALLHLLERVGLEKKDKTRIRGFSKGMKQRLGLAASLIGAPELLLLDEPTDGIDPLGRIEIRSLLAEERARGATIVLNSHLLMETERVCDRVAVLDRGKIVTEGTIEELSAIEARYVARFAPGASAAALSAIGLLAVSEDRYELTAPTPNVLDETLQRARETGALLIELSPKTQNLEDVLKRVVGGPSV